MATRWTWIGFTCIALLLLNAMQAVGGYQPAIIRLDAGKLYGGPFHDAADNVWMDDYNLQGGSEEHSIEAIHGAYDGTESIYGSSRVGRSFQYTFSPADGLAPGATYTLALHFAELLFEMAGARTLSVFVNDVEIVPGLDVFAQAGGKDRALVVSVPVELGSDGVLSLVFFGTTGEAIVAGIEVLVQPTLNINAGALSDYTEAAGTRWLADQSFIGGSQEVTLAALLNVSPDLQPVYRDIHIAPEFSYALYPADGLTPSSTYIVVLDFIEMDATAAGARLFDVLINRQLVLQRFDISAEAGGQLLVPVRRHFSVTLGSGGVLILTFIGVQLNATLAGIEIYPAPAVMNGQTAVAPQPATGPDLTPAASTTTQGITFGPVAAPEQAISAPIITDPAPAPVTAPTPAPNEATASDIVTARTPSPKQAPAPAPVTAPTSAPSSLDAVPLSTRLVPEGARNTAQEVGTQLRASEQPPIVSMAQALVQAQPLAPVTGPGQFPLVVPARGPVAAAPDPAPLNVQTRRSVVVQHQLVSAGVSVPVLVPAPGPVIALALPPAAKVPAPSGSSACADAAVLLYQRALALQERGYQQISDLFTRLINGDFQDDQNAQQIVFNLIFGYINIDAPFYDSEADACQQLPSLRDDQDQLSSILVDCTVALNVLGSPAQPPVSGPASAPVPGLPGAHPPVGPPGPPLSGPPVPPGSGGKAPATAPSGTEAPAPGPSATGGPQGDDPKCPYYPEPEHVSTPSMTSLGIVKVQLQYEHPFQAPACAPSCLLRVSCGPVSFDPQEQGWPISRGVIFEPSADNTVYTTFFYFPFSVTHFPGGTHQQVPLIMNACIDYISDPCDMTSASRIADVTYDATHPTCSISKISERFGDRGPSVPVRRHMLAAAGSQQLFVLMLFNFSKPVSSFTVDDILVRGGAVSAVLTVPNTNSSQYFVWISVTPGAGSLSISIRPGKVQDAAGNVLYSDPTSPDIFALDSDNGQYTTPLPDGSTSTGSGRVVSAMAGGGLNRSAVIGLVIGLLAGLVLVALALVGIWAILRRRNASYQKHGDGKAEQGPKIMAFTDTGAQNASPKEH